MSGQSKRLRDVNKPLITIQDGTDPHNFPVLGPLLKNCPHTKYVSIVANTYKKLMVDKKRRKDKEDKAMVAVEIDMFGSVNEWDVDSTVVVRSTWARTHTGSRTSNPTRLREWH